MATFTLDNKTIQSTQKESLFDLADALSIPIPSSCKKQGKCNECLIEIKEGEEFLSPKTRIEEDLGNNYRLSCQTFIAKEGNVVAQNLKRSTLIIEDTGVSQQNYEQQPAVYKKDKKVYLDNIAIDDYTGDIYGLVVDIGTTTVVVRLFDLENGVLKASDSFENPQRYAGTNVMARIAYDTEHGKKELKRVFTTNLSNSIETLCKTPLQIYEVLIGGNTTMRDLFFGLNVFTIGQMPYKSLTEFDVEKGIKSSTAIDNVAKKMQLPIFPKARVYGLPLIGGHVGADTAACLLAINLMEEDKTIAFMDIGTNTEIVIGNKHKAITTSSPSGPAFEGGGIVFGMPALDGAIEKIQFKGGEISIQTINNEKPKGICGSGLIDALSEFTRTEKINNVGRFEEDYDKIFIDKEETVYINENDINLLAQTKAANIAALKILFDKYNHLKFEEIDTFYLAGGFGAHIDIEAGIRIGILPDIPKEKFKRIGNATIEGLSIALLSKPKRDALENFVKSIESINLETDPNFFDYFVDGCLFEKLKQ